MKGRMIKYPLILGVIALVAGLLMALVYNVTAPIIENNAIKRENDAIVAIFGDDIEIKNISEGISSEEKNQGVNNAYIVESKGKEYYVYKITIKDGVHSDDSAAIVALQNGKIYTLKFTSVGDEYAKAYDSKSYTDSIAGKESLSDSDVVSGNTATGTNVVKSINAAIAHYGRVK